MEEGKVWTRLRNPFDVDWSTYDVAVEQNGLNFWESNSKTTDTDTEDVERINALVDSLFNETLERVVEDVEVDEQVGAEGSNKIVKAIDELMANNYNFYRGRYSTCSPVDCDYSDFEIIPTLTTLKDELIKIDYELINKRRVNTLTTSKDKWLRLTDRYTFEEVFHVLSMGLNKNSEATRQELSKTEKELKELKNYEKNALYTWCVYDQQ